MKTPAGELLAEWRKGAKKTQEDCAKIVGVQQGAWCAWETGGRSPQIKYAIRIERLTDGRVKVTDWEPSEVALPEPFRDNVPPTAASSGKH